MRLKLQYLQEVELSSTEPEARRSDGRNDRRSLGGCSGSLGIDEFPRSAIPAPADDCAMRGLATAALFGGWARPLLPFLAVGPAFWISSLGGARLPAACPRLSTMSLAGCCSFPPWPEDLVCGLGLVARRERTALRRGALWKAGVRACRRWAPPTTLVQLLVRPEPGDVLRLARLRHLCRYSRLPGVLLFFCPSLIGL